MNHISEEQFVLLYYGESPDSRDVEKHLDECETCRAEYRTLQQVLNTVNSVPVPERGPEYGRAVWQRIAGRLPKRRRFRLTSWWIWSPAMAALLVAAFLAGRISHRSEAPAVAGNQVRERILLVAVGDHLERSQMVLAEVSHSPDGEGKIDISDERARAEELLDDNRLYRETARSTGDTAMASVLDDLERVLIEIAHSPTEMSNDQLDDLRQQIEERGLLFKVRVLGSQVRDRENTPMEPTKKKNRL